MSNANTATPDTASAQLPTPSLEATTATLSGILQTHTIEKMQGTTSTMQAEVTNIKETQLSAISAQHHLSNQVLGLQNRNEKFFTSLHDLPLEIIIQMFAWIPVRTVFRYRRLSKTINQCLPTTQFAVLNMRTSDFLKGPRRRIGGLWLVVPPKYLTVFACAMAPHAKIIGGFDYYPADYNKVAKSLPNSISCFTAVEEIILERNGLIGEIPDVFGALKNLTMLRLRHNSLKGAVPSSLDLLSELQHLDLSENELTGEFPPLPNLKSLDTVFIGRNRFKGPLPTVFGDPRKLKGLCAEHNCFSVIPTSISQFTNLFNLSICGNPFSCEIPSELWNMESLQFLEMSGCSMFGSLAGVGNLHNLKTLDVWNNQFSGEFPSREILNLHELYELHIAGNQFTGGGVMDVSQRNVKIRLCADRDFKRTVTCKGFRQCDVDHVSEAKLKI
ncbi:hypothetical protein HDU80_010668 [Chytriomyces hyalinus]|nr:hypothetical protein HDU80_010668 [Chytriomyces hyalinus]